MRKLEQDYYLKMPSGPPTQGDIWDGLPSPYLMPPQCSGIIITPRCDLAHDKAPVLNFLPLLSVKDCLRKEGGYGLLERELRDAGQAVKRAAASLGASEVLEVTDDPERILKSLGDKNDAKAEQAKRELMTGVARIKEMEELLKSSELRIDAIRTAVRKKAMTQFKDDLIHNRISDLHFLPPCPPLFREPQVVMIRYVAILGKEFIQGASSCLGQDAWERVRVTKSTFDFSVSARKPERLARLRSPFLESLMARFGSLFARVGTRDIDPEYVAAFLAEEV